MSSLFPLRGQTTKSTKQDTRKLQSQISDRFSIDDRESEMSIVEEESDCEEEEEDVSI